ncbi:TetR/AcrR family transcriptional regulator [Kribbella sp. NPDC051620]|uniref:TetR/AcrR family transcriptional regulator n=1 Tax=Kribbella sp. NPDC051620 TaxID=3364120 RepID=UPI0037B0F3D5
MARMREFDTEAAVEAAMTSFRRTGFAGTSIQDLVDATGLGRGSLYAAFGNKEGLYLAALDLYHDRYAVPLMELLRSGAPARELIRAVMISVVDEVVGDGRQEACLIVSSATERARHDAVVQTRLKETIHSLEGAFFDLIAHAQGTGELPATHRPLELAKFLVMTLQGIRVIGAVDPDRAALTASVELAVNSLD